MKINYPGLLPPERLPSGSMRYRVRVRGNKSKRIRIYCSPEHEKFREQYLSARAGIAPEKIDDTDIQEIGIHGSLGWLLVKYMAWFEKQVKEGRKSHKTLKKKRNLFTRLDPYLDMNATIPEHQLIKLQDAMSSTPAQADALIEALGVMFKWAIKRKMLKEEYTGNVDRIYKKGKGAKPWTAADLKKYLGYHKIGTKAHTAIQVLLWTGCRVEDLTVLGRHNECIIEGVEAVRFQPLKKGSSEVVVPLTPQMKASTRALKVQGKTYLLGHKGKPYSSGDSMSSTFIGWCKEAGLEGRSAHGVRKALAELLTELGCNQYILMAILGHSEARTSEIYTREVNRWKLAIDGMARLQVSHGWF